MFSYYFVTSKLFYAVEYVVFVKPSALQLSIFAKILQQDSLSSLIRGSTARTLALINNLTKISNSPILLQHKDDEKDKNEGDTVLGSGPIREAMKLLPLSASHCDVSLSGQHAGLYRLLREDLTAGNSIRQTGCAGEHLERNSQGQVLGGLLLLRLISLLLQPGHR